MGVDLLDQKCEWRCRDLVGRGWLFFHARAPTHSPPDVKTGRGTPRSLYTLLRACVHVLVLLAAGFALCFGESINLT